MYTYIGLSGYFGYVNFTMIKKHNVKIFFWSFCEYFCHFTTVLNVFLCKILLGVTERIFLMVVCFSLNSFFVYLKQSSQDIYFFAQRPVWAKKFPEYPKLLFPSSASKSFFSRYRLFQIC